MAFEIANAFWIGITALISGGGVWGYLKYRVDEKKDASACLECKRGIEARFGDGDKRMDTMEKNISEIHKNTSKTAQDVSYIKGLLEGGKK